MDEQINVGCKQGFFTGVCYFSQSIDNFSVA